ncbi:SAC3/GANP/Nin1/mts3/eIF-3 p25 family-domain-containing protein [Amylostereum chailletii]|nr:SAC3/GANP/Nin1/mts3/eIF-3 p25 family-domain-containing protein [Amylostereum chailletii]
MSASGEGYEIDEPELETQEERERFYQELVKAREVERKRAIAEGKMDDPLVAKRLEEAITVVGTCLDMCPRFERYRRERENNLFEWEVIPGTRRIDHKRAVKMYERAAGDKILPSDLRPPPVLKRTLNYLFHDLLPRAGFSPTFNFIRDRSRAVRNDFTIQQEKGALAMECHERCARFHILAIHFERDTTGFSIALEEQQLMNTLQSLKEFYEDQRGRYESPNELEMRIYHRLIHIRDQRERHDNIPSSIVSHPVFLLTTKFRQHVQKKSSPISKNSTLVVDSEAMEIFGELATVLSQQGSTVMVYLVACILERLFGKDTIDDIEGIRRNMAIPDMIDGVFTDETTGEGETDVYSASIEDGFLSQEEGETQEPVMNVNAIKQLNDGAFKAPPPSTSTPMSSFPPSSSSNPAPVASAFSGLVSKPNPFGGTTSAFGGVGGTPFGGSGSAFGLSASTPTPNVSPFGGAGKTDAFGRPISAFGASNGPAQATTSLASAPPLFSDSTTVPSTSSSPDTGLGTSAFMPSNSSTGPSTSFGLGSKPPTPFGTFPTPSNGFNPPSVRASSPPKASIFPKPLNPQAPSFTPFAIPGSSSPPVSNPTEPAAPAGVPLPTPFSRPTLPPLTTTPPSLTRTPTLVLPDPGTTSPVKTQFTQDSPLFDPPALSKPHPISLPPTPTASSYASPVKGKSAQTLFGWPSQQSFSNNPDILSPLSLTPRSSFTQGAQSTPSKPYSLAAIPASLSRRPSAVDLPLPSSPLKSEILPASHGVNGSSKGKEQVMDDIAGLAPTSPVVNGRGKGKERVVDKAALVKQASAFACRTTLVKNIFRAWAKKAADSAAYSKAVRRSTEYSKRIQHERLTTSTSVPMAVDGRKKRDIFASVGTAPSRRVRRRISNKYAPPRTDEELARRLKENHEEHARRWAKGSFLEGVREHVHKAAGVYPFDWSIWVGTNQSSDATAIWVDSKFDIPDSGSWLSEFVFSIPLKPGDDQATSPGLIVFECAPLEGIDDDLERKYRVLDDCSRLRAIIELLPVDRHFKPAIVFIAWGDNSAGAVPDELDAMAKKYEGLGALQSRRVFSLSSKTKDLDEKFGQVLDELGPDVSGALVEIMTTSEILDIALSPWTEFASDWMSRCVADGEVDWALYSEVLLTLIALINKLSGHFTSLVESDARAEVIPSLNVIEPKSSDTLYNAAYQWLDRSSLRTVSQECHAFLESHRSMHSVFPADAFIDHIYNVARQRILANARESTAQHYPVLKREIASTKHEMEKDIARAAETLREVFAFHVRPKKRGPDDDELGRPSSSQSNKKLKMAVSVEEPIVANGDTSFNMPPPPSPSLPSRASSITATEESSPPKVVTVAMLRALSRNVLKSRPRAQTGT